MRRITVLLACAACLGACGDDPPGMGPGADAGVDSDADTDADSDADSDSDTDADADGGADSGAAGPCTETHQLFVLWPDAVVTEPMAMGQNDDPSLFYVYTSVDDAGTAVASFDVPCDDTWYLWGIAQTGMGTPLTVPNTFFAAIDGAPEALWELQVALASSPWSWNQGGTDGTLWAPALDAGPHALAVRGGEQDWFSNLPRLGPIVLVNDPAWTPPEVKDPLP